MIGIYKKTDPAETSRKISILKKMQLLPLFRKVELSKNIIIDSLSKGPGMILYSGGKDSTVLMHLVLSIKKDIPIIFNNTGLTSESVLKQLRSQVKGYNYIETVSMDAVEMWREKGHYPILAKRQFTAYKKKIPGLKTSPVQCCYWLKEYELNKVVTEKGIKVLFWGNRAGESNRRRLNFVDNGFLFKLKKKDRFNSYPLQHWTQRDVLTYLDLNCKKFKIVDTGCMVCATGIKHGFNNLHKLYVKNREKWKYYMRAGMGKEILKLNNINPDRLEEIIEKAPGLLCQVSGKKIKVDK